MQAIDFQGVISLEGIETVEHTTETLCGKTYPITITRRRGLHSLKIENGEEHFVDAVTMTDAGRLGVSRCYTIHSDYSDEACSTGHKAIQETLIRVMDEQGLW